MVFSYLVFEIGSVNSSKAFAEVTLVTSLVTSLVASLVSSNIGGN